MKTYTFGEIARLGLLKDKNGKPITDKSIVSRRLRLEFTLERDNEGQYGTGYSISEEMIEEHNALVLKKSGK